LYLGVLACLAALAGWLTYQYNTGVSPTTNPEDGSVTSSAYTNAYFGLSYPLPSGWVEDVAGPGPSESGYYVLGSFVPDEELTGTIMLTAQDMFFASKSPTGAAEMVANFRQSMASLDGMVIDDVPPEETIAGRLARRVDYNGVGLYRSMIALDIRCHLVSFILTSGDRGRLADMVLSLNNLSSQPGSSPPKCIKGYAAGDNVLHKVEPVLGGREYESIPVRIIIGRDGGVKHIHVIRGLPEHRKAVEEAVAQWKFKPLVENGRAVEVETGLRFVTNLAGGSASPERSRAIHCPPSPAVGRPSPDDLRPATS